MMLRLSLDQMTPLRMWLDESEAGQRRDVFPLILPNVLRNVLPICTANMGQSRISALGLDVGKKRIGVAGCDGTGLIATGLTTIERRSFQQDVEALRQLVAERQVQVLVIGLPYTMAGSLGFQAKQVQKFAQRLAQALQLPVEYVDERLTSFQAEQLLHAENRSPSRHKALIDRKAAAIILQQWLDENRQRLPDPLDS